MATSPYLRTPITDCGGSMINHQTFGRCAKMELAAMECLEAYGLHRGQKKCQDMLHDYHECHTNEKQMKRILAMRAERYKQIEEGKLKGKDKWAPPPQQGIY